MRCSRAAQLPASAPRASARDWWWLGRWLLVLLLAWDQVGSPLHQHHHDSGVDGHWPIGQEAAVPVGGQHPEDADDDPNLSHATLAVRVQADPSDEPAAGTGIALLLPSWQALILGQDGPECAMHWPDERPPPGECHLCLPPAGRAPPLHV